MRDGGGLNQGGICGYGGNRMNSGYVLEIDTCWESGSGQKRGIKGNPEFWA